MIIFRIKECFKKNAIVICTIVIVAIAIFSLANCPKDSDAQVISIITPVDIHFSPFEQCVPYILDEINKAQHTIHGSLYGIDNALIADALIAKAHAGVQIKIGEDKLQSAGKHDLHTLLQQAGIDVIIKKSSVLEHNKYIIIDGATVVSGSFNFSKAAQAEDNNLEIYRNVSIANMFEYDFKNIMQRDEISQMP